MPIQFEKSKDFHSALAWVYSPDKSWDSGQAKHYVRLEQIEPDRAVVAAHVSGSSYLARYVKAVAPIGETYLLDGGDVKERLSKIKSVQSTGLELKLNQSSLSFKYISSYENGKAKSPGRLRVAIYPGDLADFPVPSMEDAEHIASIPGESLALALTWTSSFSMFKGSSTVRCGLFRFLDGKMYVITPEPIKDAVKGTAFVQSLCNNGVLIKDKSFAVPGEWWEKIRWLAGGETVEFYSVDEGLLVKSDLGYGFFSIADLATCRYLEIGWSHFHHPANFQLSLLCKRTCSVDSLLTAVELQISRSTATTNEVLIVEQDAGFYLTKRDDSQGKEPSNCLYTSHCFDSLSAEWPGARADRDFLLAGLNSLKAFIQHRDKALEHTDKTISLSFFQASSRAVALRVRPWPDSDDVSFQFAMDCFLGASYV